VLDWVHLSCEFVQARNWGKSDPIKHPAAVAIRKKIEPEHYFAAAFSDRSTDSVPRPGTDYLT